MGCCAATHEALADLEVVLRKEDGIASGGKDSFLDVSLASKAEAESECEEMPEPLFFLDSGGKAGSTSELEKYLRRGQRSWTLTTSKPEQPWTRIGKHTRAASMNKSPMSDVRPDDASTNASIKVSFNDRFLTSK